MNWKWVQPSLTILYCPPGDCAWSLPWPVCQRWQEDGCKSESCRNHPHCLRQVFTYTLWMLDFRQIVLCSPGKKWRRTWSSPIMKVGHNRISQMHQNHQTGQCEYLIVTLADSMLEPIIPKARESKKFIDKWVTFFSEMFYSIRRVVDLESLLPDNGKAGWKWEFHRCLMQGGKVLVHCNDGMSRAPALVGNFWRWWNEMLIVGDCLHYGDLLHGLQVGSQPCTAEKVIK